MTEYTGKSHSSRDTTPATHQEREFYDFDTRIAQILAQNNCQSMEVNKLAKAMSMSVSTLLATLSNTAYKISTSGYFHQDGFVFPHHLQRGYVAHLLQVTPQRQRQPKIELSDISKETIQTAISQLPRNDFDLIMKASYFQKEHYVNTMGGPLTPLISRIMRSLKLTGNQMMQHVRELLCQTEVFVYDGATYRLEVIDAGPGKGHRAKITGGNYEFLQTEKAEISMMTLDEMLASLNFSKRDEQPLAKARVIVSKLVASWYIHNNNRSQFSREEFWQLCSCANVKFKSEYRNKLSENLRELIKKLLVSPNQLEKLDPVINEIYFGDPYVYQISFADKIINIKLIPRPSKI